MTETTSTAPAQATGVHISACILAIATLVLVVMGGLVTSFLVGDTIPDWPLALNKIWPDPAGGAFYEFSHRVIAGGVGLLALGVMIAVLMRDSRRGVRRLSIAVFLLVVIQALVGGFRVLVNEQGSGAHDAFVSLFGSFGGPVGIRITVAIVHALFAQMVFMLMVALAVVTSSDWLQAGAPVVSEDTRRTRRLAWMTIGFLFVQLLLGAFTRHINGQIVMATNSQLPADAQWLTKFWHAGFGLHALMAVMVIIHVLLLFLRVSGRHKEVGGLQRAGMLMLILLLVQVALGAGAAVVTWPSLTVELSGGFTSGLRSLHVVVGAMLLSATLIVGLRSYRLLATPDAGPSAGEKGLSAEGAPS